MAVVVIFEVVERIPEGDLIKILTPDGADDAFDAA